MPFEMDSTISIHAPREGGRPARRKRRRKRERKFQSTPPARGATLSAIVHFRIRRISIHAPARGAT